MKKNKKRATTKNTRLWNKINNEYDNLFVAQLQV